jgi:hypothetical protein
MSEGIRIAVKLDTRGQQEKSAIMRRIPRAFRFNATEWASLTIRYIKQSYKGGRVFKRAPKELDQRLGFVVKARGEDHADIVLGTGAEIGREEVVYAKIQEEGGWIFPKKAKALAIPFPGVKGSPSMYRPDSFIFKSKAGNAIIATKVGKRGRLKPLFLLQENVKLPPRHWFTRPIGERMPELTQAMSAEGVWATASRMAYKRTAAQGGTE